jgi:hypothetical protein
MKDKETTERNELKEVKSVKINVRTGLRAGGMYEGSENENDNWANFPSLFGGM